MDKWRVSALVGLIPAGAYALATHTGEAALPIVASVGALVVAGGLHVAWRAGLRQG